MVLEQDWMDVRGGIWKIRGLATMWDESKVSLVEFLKGGYSLSVKFRTQCNNDCWVTIIYGATDYRERRFLWPELTSVFHYCLEPWCLEGDFNIIRWVHD